MHTQLPPRPRTAPRTEGPGTPKGDAPRSMPAMARAHHGEVPFLPRQTSRSEERRCTCFAAARDAPRAAKGGREPRERTARVYLVGGAALQSAIVQERSKSPQPPRWTRADEKSSVESIHAAEEPLWLGNGRSPPEEVPPRGEARGGAGIVVRCTVCTMNQEGERNGERGPP